MAEGTQDFQVGEFRLDLDRGTLTRSGVLAPIRAKAFNLLCHLARNVGRVVSKDELLDAVWPGVTVTEDSLTQAMRDLRRAIGDERGEVVRTIPRRGYLFAIPIDAPAPAAPAGAMPRVAVLPFRNLTGDEGDGILIDGLVEEITNGLARFKSVTIIARHSAFAFRPEDGAPHDEIASRLDADFLVEGSARRAGGRFVVAAGLAEARVGRQVWGESFDCAAEELLSLQQVIPRRIIPRLVSNIEGSVLARTAAAPTASLSAFEHFARGVALLRSYGEGANARARDHLLQAVETDPGFAVAHAYLALAEMVAAGFGAPRDVILAAKARAMTAIELAPEEARCHRLMGLVRCQLGEFAAAEQDVRHAVELNPYDADSMAYMCLVLCNRGRAAEALEWLDRAVALNPLHPYYYFSERSIALYLLGRYDEAAADLERLPHLSARRETRMAATLALAGRPEEAARHLDRAEALEPGWPHLEATRFYTFERADDLEHLRAGIRAALEWRAKARAGPAAQEVPPGR